MTNEKDIPRRINTAIPLAVRMLLWQGQAAGKRELNIKIGRDGASVSASFVTGGNEHDSPLLTERRVEHD